MVEGPCVITVVQHKIKLLRKIVACSDQYRIVQYTDGKSIHIRGPEGSHNLPEFVVQDCSSSYVTLGVGEVSHGIRANQEALVLELHGAVVYMKAIDDRLVTISRSVPEHSTTGLVDCNLEDDGKSLTNTVPESTVNQMEVVADNKTLVDDKIPSNFILIFLAEKCNQTGLQPFSRLVEQILS